MDGNLGELVDEAARDLGLNDYQLSAAIGLLEGNRVYSPKQVGRLRRGQVKHPAPEVVERLVVVLRLDAAEAFAAARVLPAGVDAEMLRKLDIFASRTPIAAGMGRTALTQQYVKYQAQVSRVGTLIPFPVERRQHDRRRAKPLRRKVVVADVVRVDRMVASR